jgi:hypothetical protein
LLFQTSGKRRRDTDMKFSWKLASVLAVLGLGIIGSLAVAAPKRSYWHGWSAGSDDPPQVKLAIPKEHLSALAAQLGVSVGKLQSALDKVRDKLGPPELPVPPKRPSLGQIERRCTDATDALGSELGKSGDDVRSAIKAVIKSHIEKAVDAGGLSRARADKMIAQIDAAKCLPPFGPHIAFGCGPGPGVRGGRFAPAPFPGQGERPAGPPVPLGLPAM